MTALDVTLAGRAAAERLMVDSCRVNRPTGLATDENGVVTPTFSLVYEGKCKVQQTISQSANPLVAEHRATIQQSQLHIPVGAGPVRVDDVVEVLTAVMNPAMVGNVYRVVETDEKSWSTAQRVRVEEVTA